jgi:hypothetical protein
LELPDEDSDEGEEAISEELSELAELDSELALDSMDEQASSVNKKNRQIIICNADFK